VPLCSKKPHFFLQVEPYLLLRRDRSHEMGMPRMRTLGQSHSTAYPTKSWLDLLYFGIEMKPLQVGGLVLGCLGFLALGFFWGGPGFVFRDLGAVARYGPYVSLLIFFVGVVMFIVGSIRRGGSN